MEADLDLELNSEKLKELTIKKCSIKNEIIKFLLIFITVFHVYITCRYFLISELTPENASFFTAINNWEFINPLNIFFTFGCFSIPFAIIFVYKAISEIKKKSFKSVLFIICGLIFISFPISIEMSRYLMVG